jgi:hypothetical protein
MCFSTARHRSFNSKLHLRSPSHPWSSFRFVSVICPHCRDRLSSVPPPMVSQVLSFIGRRSVLHFSSCTVFSDGLLSSPRVMRDIHICCAAILCNFPSASLARHTSNVESQERRRTVSIRYRCSSADHLAVLSLSYLFNYRYITNRECIGGFPPSHGRPR